MTGMMVEIDMNPPDDGIVVALLPQKEIGLADIDGEKKNTGGVEMDIGKGKVNDVGGSVIGTNLPEQRSVVESGPTRVLAVVPLVKIASLSTITANDDRADTSLHLGLEIRTGGGRG